MIDKLNGKIEHLEPEILVSKKAYNQLQDSHDDLVNGFEILIDSLEPLLTNKGSKEAMTGLRKAIKNAKRLCKN